MKKMKVLLVVAFLSICTIMWAQVPDNIKEKFKKSYPEVTNAQWEKGSSDYTATYTDAHKLKHHVIYDMNGNVTRTQHMMGAKQFPQAITEYFIVNYPGMKDYEVWSEDDQAGSYSYFVPEKAETYYFDRNGNFVRKEEHNMVTVR